MGNSSNQYDEDYFLRGKETGKSLYTAYRWLPNLTIPMVSAMIQHLGIRRRDTILDFGCARGYVVRAFHKLEYKNTWGYDISRWALENSDETIKKYLIANSSTIYSNQFDWIIAKDVLEHIGDDELVAATETLKTARKGILVIVPLAHGIKYDVPEYEMDVTHIHRRPLSWWVEHFHQAGWSVEGRYRIKGVKDNYSQYPTGNGFITCRRLSD